MSSRLAVPQMGQAVVSAKDQLTPVQGTVAHHAFSEAGCRLGHEVEIWHRPKSDLSLPTKVQPVLVEDHAVAVKHTVMRVEKTMGVVKAYLQLKAVTAKSKWRALTQSFARVPKCLPGVRPVATLIPPRTKKHGEKKSERAEEVPISPGKPLRVKVDGAH